MPDVSFGSDQRNGKLGNRSGYVVDGEHFHVGEILQAVPVVQDCSRPWALRGRLCRPRKRPPVLCVRIEAPEPVAVVPLRYTDVGIPIIVWLGTTLAKPI